MSISGKKLGFRVNGTLVTGNYRWTARGVPDKLDRTTGSDGGYTNTDPGCRELTVTATVYIDLTDGIGVSIDDSDILENVELFRDIDDVTPAYVMAEALVTSAEESGEVRGKLEYALEFVNRGAFTHNVAVA